MNTISDSKKRYRALLGFGGAAATAAIIAVTGLSASAAPGDTADGSTVGNVTVQSAISLTALTPSFNLTGLPGATVLGTAATTFNVETNNIGGYAVTVTAATASLLPADTTANPNVIPISALSVRETGTTPFTPVSNVTPTTVHTQPTRSAEGGDTLSNDYRVVIPFVNEDTYSVTLDYVATTL